MKKEINLLLAKNNVNLILDRESNINSFEMDKDYFLDVFLTRYEISLMLDKPIIGLKDVLNNVQKIKIDKLLSTTIKVNDIEITIYSDNFFSKLYGIVYFGDAYQKLR